MGKLIGGIVMLILKIISYIPFIGMPLVRLINFLLENLLRLFANLLAFIKMLPAIMGTAFVIVIILALMGYI